MSVPQASVVSENTAKSYKGNLYYPILDVQLSSSSGTPVTGHVRMKTGWGFLSSAEGDAEVSIPFTAAPPQEPGKFSAPMRRGFVTVEVTGARCINGFYFPTKKTRVLHLRKQAVKITWNKSEGSSTPL